jgi:hypothetical protein
VVISLYTNRAVPCTVTLILFFQYDEKSVITIARTGQSEPSGLEQLHNNFVYRGKENTLILTRVYTTSFTCKFDMTYYPFDMQMCSMIFVMQVSKLMMLATLLMNLQLDVFKGKQRQLYKAAEGPV